MESGPIAASIKNSEKYTESAVLVIAFNRPDSLKVLIDRLRTIKPKKIYFAVDGAREGRTEEAQLVIDTRALATSFDWDCSVATKFSEVNLGCGLGVSSAISWVFETESKLIVLEDDIIPDFSFFPYCEELLEIYESNKEVFAISGCNFVPVTLLNENESYRFSQIPHVWGWALWKRSWELYEFELNDWRSQLSTSDLRQVLGGSWIATMMWARIFTLMEKKKIDTWDYQLCFAAIKNKKMIATPNVNLTENIGFGDMATHTMKKPEYILEKRSLLFPLKHPLLSINTKVDSWTQKNVMGASYPSILRLFKRQLLASISTKVKG